MSNYKRKKTILFDKIFGETVFLFLTCFVFNKKHEIKNSEIKRILIIKSGGIGDYILSIPSFKRLKEFFPLAEIDVLMFKRNINCLDFYDNFHKVTTIDLPKNLLKFIFKKEKYDLCIDFDQHRKIPSILSLLSGSKVRIGFNNSGKGKVYTHLVKYKDDEYEAQSFLNLLEPLMGHQVLFKDDLSLVTHNPQKKTIGIYACAMKEDNRLPLKKWKEIIEKHGNDHRYFFFGGKDDKERYDSLQELLSGFKIERYDGKLSLRESIQKLSEMSLFLSEDGGVYHMGVCAGVPSISYWLHGNDNMNKWGSNFPGSQLINLTEKKIKRIGIEAFSAGEATGIGTYSFNLLREISKTDSVNEYVVFVRHKDLIEYPRNFKEVVIFTPYNFLVPLWTQLLIPILGLRYKTDILHYTKGIASPMKFNKVISTVHDLIPVLYPESNKNLFYYLYWKFGLNTSIKKSDFIIANSEYTKESIKKVSAREHKISVVYLGCDHLLFKRASQTKVQFIKEKYNLPNNFILFVGNLRDSKNIKIVLKSIEILNNEGEKLNLVIVGEKKWKNKDFDKVFGSLKILKNRVFFTGRVGKMELPIFYSAADVFVFPSLYEGFGLPIIEAQSCGCPVICSNTTSLPEVVNNPDLMFNPNNVCEFIGILKKMKSNNVFRVGVIEKGLINKERFSWNITASETIKIYESNF